jgi:hypothetical protein
VDLGWQKGWAAYSASVERDYRGKAKGSIYGSPSHQSSPVHGGAWSTTLGPIERIIEMAANLPRTACGHHVKRFMSGYATTIGMLAKLCPETREGKCAQ